MHKRLITPLTQYTLPRCPRTVSLYRTSIRMVSHASINIDTAVKLNNGKQMPLFGFGTWRSEPGLVAAAVEAALSNGYRHIDCAVAYENHKEVAEGIKSGLKKNNLKREDIWITSKLWNTHKHPKRATVQIDNILKDLQIDYLDQLLIHWPVSWEDSENGKLFPENPIHDKSHTREDTWRTMESYVESGKIKTIGISNFKQEEVSDLLKYAKIKPAVNQIESHPYLNNIALQKWLKEQGIETTAYSPLGLVSGDISKSPLAEQSIKSIAEKHNKSPAQVIIRWHLQSGRITIPKSVKEERVKENADVFNFELSDDEVQQINKLDKGAAGRQVNPPFLPGKAKVSSLRK